MEYGTERDSGYYVHDAYKDYGYVNGWTETPEEVRECERKRHRMFTRAIGRCVTEYGCEICGFKFQVDSSD